jgi:general secretion pathway protein G
MKRQLMPQVLFALKKGFTPLEAAADFSRRLSSDKADNGLRHQSAQTVRERSSLTGFTLIELMLVVIIIGALVAMVMPRLTGRGEQARVAVARADIQSNIATGLKMYEMDIGIFPTTEEGLGALFTKSSSANNWNGPYLEKKPIDPWNREYKYKSPGEHRADYDLFSLGKDGVESADDVKNWE